MKKILTAVLVAAVAAFAASAQPGPGPVPSPWIVNGTATYKASGQVGIGTATPNSNNALTVKANGTGAGLNLVPGSAPGSPNNGDLWTTSSGLFARINGSTVTFQTAPPGGTYLVSSNNLSDVANTTTSRTNIGAAGSGTNTDITDMRNLTILNVGTGGSDFGEPFHYGTNASNSSFSKVTVADTLSSGTVGHAFSVSRSVTTGLSGGINDYDSRSIYSGTGNIDHLAAFQAIPTNNGSGEWGHFYGLVVEPIWNAGTLDNYEAISIGAPVVTGSGTVLRRTPIVTYQSAGNTCLGAVVTASVVDTKCDIFNFTVNRQTNVTDTGNIATFGIGFNIAAVPYNGCPSAGYNFRNNGSGTPIYNTSDYASMITYCGGTDGMQLNNAVTGTTGGTITWVNTAKFTTTGTFLQTLPSDATHTDATVCADSSTGLLYKGSGTLGVCLGTSSRRYKRDIAPLAPGLAEVLRLRPRSFHVDKDHGDPDKLMYGFIAEEAASALPALVGRDKWGAPNTFDYVGVVPVLVKAVQEQQATIVHQQAEITALQARMGAPANENFWGRMRWLLTGD